MQTRKYWGFDGTRYPRVIVRRSGARERDWREQPCIGADVEGVHCMRQVSNGSGFPQ